MRIFKSLILATLLSAAAYLAASCSDKDADTRALCGAGGTCPARYQCAADNHCDFVGGPLPDAAIPDARPPDASPPAPDANTTPDAT